MSVVTLVAVVLLGFVLAYWTWVWLAPRTVPRQEIAADPASSVATANTLFGTAMSNRAQPTGLAIKLQGVVAEPGGKGKKGYAVVQLDGKQTLAVHEGEDIARGVRLAEVHPDHVILERNGIRETLALPEKKSAPATPALNNPVPGK